MAQPIHVDLGLISDKRNFDLVWSNWTTGQVILFQKNLSWLGFSFLFYVRLPPNIHSKFVSKFWPPNFVYPWKCWTPTNYDPQKCWPPKHIGPPQNITHEKCRPRTKVYPRNLLTHKHVWPTPKQIWPPKDVHHQKCWPQKKCWPRKIVDFKNVQPQNIVTWKFLTPNFVAPQ